MDFVHHEYGKIDLRSNEKGAQADSLPATFHQYLLLDSLQVLAATRVQEYINGGYFETAALLKWSLTLGVK